MADSMDLVQQRVEENLQRHIQNARARKPGTARVLCIDCDAPIPIARRQAIWKTLLTPAAVIRRTAAMK
ncbi:conjugal transfer protein TraR [Klebsiella quasipneumoniae]|nr:conjugal transfer protein TraR [Klebsiella quasipneumoniae]AWO59870.1 conjugal transfer protein TraR [Klebsiella quasipneumoniae subsp. similipneumoniae]AVF91116.1 conjugal transfer protein TraR [Klebsiella quasipneumoniae]EMR24804.1 TraR/DksA family transcriptional regulator [Klebsiella quasipneumoniae]MBK5761954.1 conjugal transfer protein TraR [Klebsiella quasipneumoniae]